eukprot:m.565190 g.565190  ORF g.565190 m.565190 type:complete len:82 (+) comp22240_c0_seq9:687-932(+)
MRNGFSTKKFQASLGPMAKTSPPTLRNVTLYLPCRGQLEYAAVGVAAGETITVLHKHMLLMKLSLRCGSHPVSCITLAYVT